MQVFAPFRGLAKAADVRRAAAAALAVADPHGEASMSVVVADDETLRELNRRFRGLDEVTDVLSFGERGEPAGEDGAAAAFPAAPGEVPSLGEVVVSYPLAARQAGEHNVGVEGEVALLVVHGALHLLGYDHAEPDEEAEMKALEVKALAACRSEVARVGSAEGEGATGLVEKAHEGRGTTP